MLGQGSICPEQKKKVYWPSKASKEKKKSLYASFRVLILIFVGSLSQ